MREEALTRLSSPMMASSSFRSLNYTTKRMAETVLSVLCIPVTKAAESEYVIMTCSYRLWVHKSITSILLLSSVCLDAQELAVSDSQQRYRLHNRLKQPLFSSLAQLNAILIKAQKAQRQHITYVRRGRGMCCASCTMSLNLSAVDK